MTITDFLIDLKQALAAPTDAWWFGPAAWASVMLLVGLLAVASVPRRFVTPLTDIERRFVGLPALARFALAAWVVALTAAVPMAAALLSFSPRRPCAIILDAASPPAGPGFWDTHITRPGLRRVDAGPLVDRVLTRVEDEGGAGEHAAEGRGGWVEGTPAQRRRLRALCMEALAAYGKGDAPPARKPARKAPAWVRQAAEMTIVAGLARGLENPAWIGVRYPHPGDGRGWDRGRRVVARPGTPLAAIAVGEAGRPVVRSLFDGRALDRNRRVQFRALVETPPGYSGRREVAFEVVDPAGVRVSRFDRPLTSAAAREVVTVDQPVGGFSERAVLIATAEGQAVRTPLPSVAGPGWTATFDVAASGLPDGLRKLWDEVLGGAPPADRPPSNPLRANLHARGLRVPALVSSATAASPTLEVLSGGRGILVLAPGLSASSLPPALLEAGPSRPVVPYPAAPGQPPGVVLPFGYRVSRVVGPATIDSLISVTADRLEPVNWSRPERDADRLPTPTPGSEPLALALRVNSPLEAGRQQRGDDAVRPLMELGYVGTRPYVLVRLDPELQRLAHDADGFSPARGRAVIAALVWASNHVLTSGRTAVSTSPEERQGPDPGPLLRAEDEEALVDLGRRPVDGIAFCILGAFLITLNLHAWFWGRPPVSGGR